MDRRTFLRNGLVLTGGLMVASCSKSSSPAKPGGSGGAAPDAPLPRPTVRLPGGAFGFPSPFGAETGLGYTQMSLLYDTLLWKDSTGNLMPWLASRFDRSADGRTYTFELRDGVRWSDGQPLTSDDVAFTFDYFAGQSLSPLAIARPLGNPKVVVTGPRTGEIHIEQPLVIFPEFVAGALAIVPRHVWAPIADGTSVEDPKLLVGSGPYKLDSYKGNQGALAYSANDGYFLGKPFVRRIEMTPVGDEFNALMAGQIDSGGGLSVSGVRPEVIAPFRNDSAFGVIEEKGNFTFPLFWNLKRGGALADVRFRRACATAIDRGDIVKRLAGGNGEPGNPGFLPKSNPFHVDVEQYPFNRDAANRMLDDAGYPRGGGGTRQAPGGAPLRFELLVANDPAATALAAVLIDALKAVGIELTTRAVELGPALFGAKLSGNFDMALTLYPGPSGGGPNADPDQLRQIYSSTAGGGLNGASGYVNPELNALADRQLITSDGAERKRIIGDMQRIVARDIPVLPLYYTTVFNVFRKAVLDQWYFTPGQFPVSVNNKQLFITGVKTGTKIRPTR